MKIETFLAIGATDDHFRSSRYDLWHCARRIIEAVMAVDLGAKVEVDVNGRFVKIQPSERSESELGVAIRNAGYAPRLVPPTAATTAGSMQPKCCCRA